jgi:hypothetical protein
LAQRLLYLLERTSIFEAGWPTFGGSYVATEDGPFLQELNDQIQAEKPGPDASTEWLRTFTICDRRITLRRPVENFVISRKDRQRLESIYNRYSSLTYGQMIEALETDCPEWAKFIGSTFSLKDVLVANGWQTEDAVKLEEQVRLDWNIIQRRTPA